MQNNITLGGQVLSFDNFSNIFKKIKNSIKTKQITKIIVSGASGENKKKLRVKNGIQN